MVATFFSHDQACSGNSRSTIKTHSCFAWTNPEKTCLGKAGTKLEALLRVD